MVTTQCINNQANLKEQFWNEHVMLTADQFNWLLSGLDFAQHKLLPEVKACNYY